jgi:hypothetical protein
MEKRVTLIAIGTHTLMRTVRSEAEPLVAAGTHRYTTKGKLKSFINREMKLYRTGNVVRFLQEDFEANKDNKKSRYYELGLKKPFEVEKDEVSGKTYMVIPLKIAYIPTGKVNSIGMPDFETKLRAQLRVVAWPEN